MPLKLLSPWYMGIMCMYMHIYVCICAYTDIYKHTWACSFSCCTWLCSTSFSSSWMCYHMWPDLTTPFSVCYSLCHGSHSTLWLHFLFMLVVPLAALGAVTRPVIPSCIHFPTTHCFSSLRCYFYPTHDLWHFQLFHRHITSLYFYTDHIVSSFPFRFSCLWFPNHMAPIHTQGEVSSVFWDLGSNRGRASLRKDN